jgi:hypothetical protein
MKGQNRLSADEAAEIRLLARGRVAAPGGPQTALRHRPRALEFSISDWRGRTSGFSAADFDALIACGPLSVTPPPSGARSSAARADAHEPAESARAALRASARYVKQTRCGRVPDCAERYAPHGPPAV